MGKLVPALAVQTHVAGSGEKSEYILHIFLYSWEGNWKETSL
jgi:hypothetical protein